MKIINLTEGCRMYTSNVYLIRGTWNALQDINTLVDVGRDPVIIDNLRNAPTGVGKHKVDQVILTHNHYDHTGNLPALIEAFHPAVYAFSSSVKGMTHQIRDGDTLPCGDSICELIHMPGHSTDSICVYFEAEGVLFAGDSPVVIRSTDNAYPPEFVNALHKLGQRHIEAIYFGHGEPLLNDCDAVIARSLQNLTSA
jgi:glyoxylase-like metal-dependent hydrolase (beta-lactamase superfamily II)